MKVHVTSSPIPSWRDVPLTIANSAGLDALPAGDARRFAYLLEYRATACIEGVYLATPAELDALEDFADAPDLGPKVTEIDWSGFDVARVDAVAPALNRDAREAAHAEVAVANPTDATALAFIDAYLQAFAAVLGRASAAQCPEGEAWNHAEWLQGDWDALCAHAAMLGVNAAALRALKVFTFYRDAAVA